MSQNNPQEAGETCSSSATVVIEHGSNTCSRGLLALFVEDLVHGFFFLQMDKELQVKEQSSNDTQYAIVQNIVADICFIPLYR